MRFRPAASAALVLTALATASVVGTSVVGVTAASAAKTKQPATITVLVTNDDGVGAPGIDALVEALRKQKHTKVVVVAPDSNKTGTSGTTTEGPLPTAATTTASGYTATAVTGFPADTITAALDQLGVKPNVVMSGINVGQNMGTLTNLSGTVGAAKAAAARGIPALAISQGFADAPQYDSGAKLAVDWLNQHRATLAKKPKTAPTTIANLNVPNCPSGKPRGVKNVVTADTNDKAFIDADCAAQVTAPKTDIEAFNAGWAALAPVTAG